MHIIGPSTADRGIDGVHTIDLWFSRTRRRWIVERLNGEGHPIGTTVWCRTRAEALACFQEWRRRHPEAHLATPPERQRAGRVPRR